MPRIPLPNRDEMNDDQRAVYDRIVSGPRGKIQGPLRAALYNAELADKWSAIGALLRYRTSLSPRHSEIAILITGLLCHSPFEWYAHRIEAEKVGVETAVIEAILARQQPPGLSEADAIALLAKNGNLVKRPFLIGGGKTLSGFKPDVWGKALQ